MVFSKDRISILEGHSADIPESLVEMPWASSCSFSIASAMALYSETKES